MEFILPIAASSLIALLVHKFFTQFDLRLGGSPAARLDQFASTDRRTFTDRLGDSLVDRLGLSFEAWQHELMWARLGGASSESTIGSVLGRSVLFGSLGVACLLLLNAFSPAYVLGVAAAAYYPYLQLRGRANEARERVRRALPEAAALIAAEMAAGASAETAVLRAATLPGPVGALLRSVDSSARQSARLVFSRDMQEGLLVQEFSRYRMSQLEAFARQIELVAVKGAEGPRQMGEVARGLAREYRSEVARSAEQLSNKLLFPVSLYIFVPFMLAIFVPLMVSVFESF